MHFREIQFSTISDMLSLSLFIHNLTEHNQCRSTNYFVSYSEILSSYKKINLENSGVSFTLRFSFENFPVRSETVRGMIKKKPLRKWIFLDRSGLSASSNASS